MVKVSRLGANSVEEEEVNVSFVDSTTNKDPPDKAIVDDPRLDILKIIMSEEFMIVEDRRKYLQELWCSNG